MGLILLGLVYRGGVIGRDPGGVGGGEGGEHYDHSVPIESWMERSEGELDGQSPRWIVGRKAFNNLVNRK